MLAVASAPQVIVDDLLRVLGAGRRAAVNSFTPRVWVISHERSYEISRQRACHAASSVAGGEPSEMRL